MDLLLQGIYHVRKLKKERRIAKLEQLISEHEEKIRQINEDIEGRYSADFNELQRLYAELETASSELDGYMEEYFELTDNQDNDA